MTDHSKSDVSKLVRVAELEWEKSEISGWNGDYHTVPSGYTVRCADEWGWKFSGYGSVGYAYSPEAAMRDAQADFEHRILACITTRTGTAP